MIGEICGLAAISFSGGHAEGDEDNGYGRDAYDPDGTGPMDPVDVSSFESVTGSDHNDSLTGDHRTNTLTGGKGDDSLRGNAGVDTLIGGPGADMLDGGKSLSAGADTPNDNTDDVQHIDVASYDGAKAGVTVNLASGRGTGGDAEGDTLVNIEQVLGSGNDDTFLAGPGKDNVDGGGNTAAAEGGMGDTMSYELSPEAINLTLVNPDPDNPNTTPDPQADNGTGTGNKAEDQDSYSIDDILNNIENVIGTDYGDTITGNNQPNTLKGGGGGDKLTGGEGKDMLDGGAGKDELTGDAGDDTLKGGAGVDTIDGGAGNDTIDGGTGGDNLKGGDNNDTFVFGPDAATANDIISDWNTGSNKINLSAFGIDAEDLPGLLEVRGGALRIDLNAYGGGTIELTGVNSVDTLDGANATVTGTLDGDFLYNDINGDGDTEDTINGVAETDGVFIL